MTLTRLLDRPLREPRGVKLTLRSEHSCPGWSRRPEVDIHLNAGSVAPGVGAPHREVPLLWVSLEVRVDLRTEYLQPMPLRHPRGARRLPGADQKDGHIARAECRRRLPRNVIRSIPITNG